jgi:hypothetical protein
VTKPNRPNNQAQDNNGKNDGDKNGHLLGRLEPQRARYGADLTNDVQNIYY